MVQIKLTFIAIFAFSIVFTEETVTEESICNRIYAHFIIRDFRGALRESQRASQKLPLSPTLAKLHIEAIAAVDQESRMIDAYGSLCKTFPEIELDRALLEAMAWRVIERGARSASPATVSSALLAAYRGNDSRGVMLIMDGLRHHNSVVREVAVTLAGQMRDTVLQDRVVFLLQKERVFSVRLAAIRAVGKMKIKKARALCENILYHSATSYEEKIAAIESILRLMDRSKPFHLQELVESHRANMRLLACQMIALCGSCEDVDFLIPLLTDTQSEIRALALQVIGLLDCRIDEKRQAILDKQRDAVPFVAISASWLSMRMGLRGEDSLRFWITHSNRKVRLLAAAALSSTGKYGLSLMQEIFLTTDDPYVRLNLAVGLIGQQTLLPEASEVLYQSLSLSDQWMWKKKGVFRYICPSTISHEETIVNYPEAINQLTRLEVINILAIQQDPRALDSLRLLLSEKNWGVCGMAALLLLSEGAEDAVEVVSSLLTDAEERVSTQAALVLGILGGDTQAIKVLERAYPQSGRATKEKILEAIGKIGCMSSVAFLIKCLKEPHQNLRISASAALIQCLNH